MKQEKLFDLLKAAVSPCECVKAAKQELLENGFEEIDYTGDWKLVRGGRYVLNHHDTTMFAFTVGSGYNKKDMVRIAAAHRLSISSHKAKSGFYDKLICTGQCRGVWRTDFKYMV